MSLRLTKHTSSLTRPAMSTGAREIRAYQRVADITLRTGGGGIYVTAEGRWRRLRKVLLPALHTGDPLISIRPCRSQISLAREDKRVHRSRRIDRRDSERRLPKRLLDGHSLPP